MSVLFCFVLFCFVLFCFVLFCFVLFCFVLFCFVWLCLVFAEVSLGVSSEVFVRNRTIPRPVSSLLADGTLGWRTLPWDVLRSTAAAALRTHFGSLNNIYAKKNDFQTFFHDFLKNVQNSVTSPEGPTTQRHWTQTTAATAVARPCTWPLQTLRRSTSMRRYIWCSVWTSTP